VTDVGDDGLSLTTVVDCLLLSLSDRQLRLLVPLTAVAEVLDELPELASTVTGHPWLYGWLPWRQHEVPLLAYEGVAGGSIAPLWGDTRVVIFNAIGAAAAHRFYGIAIRSLPRPLRLGRESDLQARDVTPPQGAALLVDMGAESAAIPDFELLERLVVDAQARRP